MPKTNSKKHNDHFQQITWAHSIIKPICLWPGKSSGTRLQLTVINQ